MIDLGRAAQQVLFHRPLFELESRPLTPVLRTAVLERVLQDTATGAISLQASKRLTQAVMRQAGR